MPDYRVTLGATVGAQWDQHGQALFDFLQANPGTNLGLVATGMGIDTSVAKRLINVIEQAGGLMRVYDVDGNEELWATPVMALMVVPSLVLVREYVREHDGATVSGIASTLDLPFAVVVRCCEILQIERDIRLDYIPS